MSSEILLFALLVVLVASTVLEQLARALQVRHQPPEPPAELAGAVDEVVAVVAHEVGHERGRHVPKLRAVNVAAITFTLFLMSLLVESSTLSAALGASERVVALNLIGVSLLLGPVSMLLGVLGNALSRRFEDEADGFAARTTSPAAMCTTLRSFVQHDLTLATAHPLYTALELTHPAPVERIRAITAADATPA